MKRHFTPIWSLYMHTNIVVNILCYAHDEADSTSNINVKCLIRSAMGVPVHTKLWWIKTKT